MKSLLVCAAGLYLACVACNSPSPRLNAPPHGTPEVASNLQGTYVSMTDNALLADMTVSDVHFVPHRPMLNALGEERLSRLAMLMEYYGGEIRFSTNEPSEMLIRDRTKSITEFLCESGVEVKPTTIRPDLPGGPGLAASEVILIKAGEGTYLPKKSGGSLASPAGMGKVQGQAPGQSQ